MAVRRKTIRTTQPSGPVPLDPYWLKRGLVLFDVGNGWIWTKQGGWQGTHSRIGPPRLQTSAKYGSVKGYGATHGVGTTDRTDGPVIALSTGIRSIVTFSYANSSGGGGIGRIFQKSGTAGNILGDESWWTNTTYPAEIVYTRIGNDSNGFWYISGSTVTGQWVGYGVTHDQRTAGLTPVMYKQGASASVTVGSAMGTSYPTGNISLDIGNRSTTGDRVWDGMLGPKLIFDHPESGLTAAEHKQLYENPYRVAIGAARRNSATSGATLTPGLFTNSNTHYAHTVTPGSVGLTPALFTNSNSFYAATVSQGDFNLAPGLLTNSNTFYAATVTAGQVALTPSLFTNSNTFYAASCFTVATFHDDHERSNINIAASSIVQDSYAPTISIYPRLHLSDTWGTAGYEFFHARITGMLNKRPDFKLRYYTTASTGVLDPWAFQSTQRCMWSYDQVTWNYFDTHALSGDNLNIDFKENADFTQDTVYVASQRPFTGTMVAAMVSSLASTYTSYVSMPTSSAGNAYVCDTIGTQTDERGRVIAAQPIYSMRITDDTAQPDDGSPKRIVVLLAGQHSSEDVGNWSIRGALEFLCSGDAKAIAARKNFEFLVYPHANPMGRYGGHWRGDFNSANPTYDGNRRWLATPGMEYVTKNKAAITEDIAGRPLAAWLDYHGANVAGYFLNSGSPLHDDFQTKMVVYTAGFTISGANPTNSSAYYANQTLGASLATHIEASRDQVPTEAQILAYGASSIKSLSDLFADNAWPALVPSLFSNTNTFYSSTVSPGAVNLTPGLFSNANSFYSATITVGFLLAPDLFTNANTFYAGAVTVDGVVVAPGLFSNASLFYTPTVSAGTIGLAPSLFTNGNTFYSPTVTDAGTILLPSLLSGLNVFYGANVTTGSVGLIPGLFSNTNTFYAHSMSGGASTRNFVNDLSILTVRADYSVTTVASPLVVTTQTTDLCV